MKGFNCLPVELYHQIFCAMDPEDILALRKTSKHFLSLSHEPRLWTSMYHRMRQTHPLGCSENEFSALAPWQPERLLVRASKTEKVFQTFRERARCRIFPSGFGPTGNRGSLVALSFLSERFLLSVDNTTVVYIWDMWKGVSPLEGPAFPCERLTLIGWRFHTYGMSSDHSTLYIVISRAARAHIFSLALPLTTSDADEPKLSFRDIAYFDTHVDRINSIDADSCFVFLQSSNTIEIMDWDTKKRTSILVHEEPAERRDYVFALRLCGPYVLCFRRLSIEAYPLPLLFAGAEGTVGQPLPVLRHTMSGMSFMAVTCLSRARCDRSLSGDAIAYTLYALAMERRGGTYYYKIHVQTTPVPALSVHLLGMDDSHDKRPRVTAWTLSSTGCRGVWALAPNQSSERHIVAFTTPPSPPYSFESIGPSSSFPALVDSDDHGELDVPPEIAPRPAFDAQLVAIMSSWGLEDDVMRCAVSEFTGRIALGSRTGAIRVL